MLTAGQVMGRQIELEIGEGDLVDDDVALPAGKGTYASEQLGSLKGLAPCLRLTSWP